MISNKGMGTNLQAIIDGIKNGKINAEIVAVISDSPDAQGLQRAKENNIPTEICPTKDDLLLILKKFNADYLCLDGWKQIILDEVLNFFENRILNVHPGLISYPLEEVVKNPDGTDAIWNKGKFTEKAIQNFLESHSTFAGSTVHFLSHEFDFGPVLERVFEKIQPGDTVDSLYSRLKVKENEAYVKALERLTHTGHPELDRDVSSRTGSINIDSVVERHGRSSPE